MVAGSSLIRKKGKFAEISTFCHSLSFVVTCCITRFHSLYHSLSFVVTHCHSLSLFVPLVVTRCITRLSFYNEIDKFTYLKSLLSESAFETISGLTVTSDNYAEAINLLQNRYENHQVLINAYISL